MLATDETRRAQLFGRMVFLQEELDWAVYRLYGLTDDQAPDFATLLQTECSIDPDDRPFNWNAGKIDSNTISPLFAESYERRHGIITTNRQIALLETKITKRLWLGQQGVYGSSSLTNAQRESLALREWMLIQLESYFFMSNVLTQTHSNRPTAAHGLPAALQPALVSTNQLAAVVETDADFLRLAEIYTGGPGFSVSKLVRKLVEEESVPFLPYLRYKESGLRKRQDWEHVWDLQRKEDAVEAQVRSQKPGASEDALKPLIREKQKQTVGDIPVPPKYASGDFKKSNWWKLRGKLDVPKERWISFPGAEREGDPSPVIAWAGWDHLQQAKALAEFYVDASQNQGWEPTRLIPLLTGIADLLPWLKQWHNDFNPEIGMRFGDYIAGFLDEEARKQGTTVEALQGRRFGI